MSVEYADRINVCVDLKNLIKELPRFFQKSDAYIQELVQNAYRAGATKVDISTEPGTISILDNGNGIKDPSALVEISRSDWDNLAVMEQNPAGMGIFSALFSAERADIESSDGSRGFSISVTKEDIQALRFIEVSCGSLVEKGTVVTLSGLSKEEAELSRMVEETVRYYTENIDGEPMRITLNNKVLPQKDFIGGDEKCERIVYTREVAAGTLALYRNSYGTTRVENVLFYGHPMGLHFSEYVHFRLKIKGLGLTPRLPDRTSFVEDEKLELFKGGYKEAVTEALERGLIRMTPEMARKFLDKRRDELVPDVAGFDISSDIPLPGNPSWFEIGFTNTVSFYGKERWKGEDYDVIIDTNEIDTEYSLPLAALYYLNRNGLKVGLGYSGACSVANAPVFTSRYRSIEDFDVKIIPLSGVEGLVFGGNRIERAEITLKDKVSGKEWKVDGVLPEGEPYDGTTYYWSLPFSPSESFVKTCNELIEISRLVICISDEDTREEPYENEYNYLVGDSLRAVLDCRNMLMQKMKDAVSEVVSNRFGWDYLSRVDLHINSQDITFTAHSEKKVYRYNNGNWTVEEKKD